MKFSSLSGCHVNEIPLRFKPFVCLTAYAIAVLGFVYCCIVRFTSKIVFIGKENLEENANYIICFWHQNIFLYFAIFLRHRRHAWMQHPIWFMKPSHILLRFLGVSKVILGSTGHSGKEAADQLVEYLRKGYSTALMPDGPHGPPFVMKKGALHISLQSHVPIVPLRFRAAHAWEIHHWDKRLWPLPFNTYVVEFGKPLQITEENIENALQTISMAMN